MFISTCCRAWKHYHYLRSRHSCPENKNKPDKNANSYLGSCNSSSFIHLLCKGTNYIHIDQKEETHFLLLEELQWKTVSGKISLSKSPRTYWASAKSCIDKCLSTRHFLGTKKIQILNSSINSCSYIPCFATIIDFDASHPYWGYTI